MSQKFHLGSIGTGGHCVYIGNIVAMRCVTNTTGADPHETPDRTLNLTLRAPRFRGMPIRYPG